MPFPPSRRPTRLPGRTIRPRRRLRRMNLRSRKVSRLIRTVSFLPEASFAPALEDINVYTLDAEILHVTNPGAAAAAAAFVTRALADSHYRIHLGDLPVISGFVGESLTTGRFLFPSVNVIEDRNTYDTYFNGGITPILHLGSNSITFNGGLQFTIRRDTISPAVHEPESFSPVSLCLDEFVL